MSRDVRDPEVCWYAMRDLSRRHAKFPAYLQLSEMGLEVFTPMTRRIVTEGGRRVSREEPFMQDLLFVHESRERLNPVVERIVNLQYRYTCGGYCKPMVVPDAEMDRFVRAVRSSRMPLFFRPGEITQEMCGRHVRIIGSALDGYEGRLLSVRGSKYRRLLVSLPGFLTAAVEVMPEYVEVKLHVQ